MGDVAVVVPYRDGGCAARAAALEWVLGRHEHPVTVAAGPDPWVKALAVHPAIVAARAPIVVVADADVWAPGLRQALEAVRDGGAAWAVPHRGVFRLDETATSQVLAGAEPHDQMPLTERAYAGVVGGGVIVARREVLLDTGLDPRFIGWGQEDAAWGLALRCLVGEPWRGRAPLFHLHHPPAPRQTRRQGSRVSWQLFRRYHAARHDPVAMRRLIEEAHRAHRAAHPTDHDHAPARPR